MFNLINFYYIPNKDKFFMHVITSYSHKLFLLNTKFAIQTYKVYFVLIREREKRQYKYTNIF